MSAPAHGQHQPQQQPRVPRGRHPMDATPAEVRAALAAHAPDDVPAFDAEWRHALDVARDRLDLAELDTVLHRWRALAWSAVDNPTAHRRLRETMAHVEAGGVPHEGVPWDTATAHLINNMGA